MKSLNIKSFHSERNHLTLNSLFLERMKINLNFIEKSL